MRTLALLLAATLVLSGCMLNAPRPGAGRTPPVATGQDSGPAVAVDRARLEALPDPVARQERRAYSGNQSPYVVLGQSYEVLQRADDYAEEGLASWYGTKFHGRATSNGEAFDMYTLTAAHKSLPIPCFVRVTNLANGRSTLVRVNDRGPFHDDRLIDLSYAAAVKLGFDLQGTAPVRVEMVAAPIGDPVPGTQLANARRSPAPAGAVPAQATVATVASAASGYYLQAGAFRSREAAERLSAALKTLLGSGVAVALERGQDSIHRVRIGPLASMAEASVLQGRLIDANQGVALIVRS